jgi:starch synthase
MSYNVLMITSETVPFAKSGGLADMVSALSIALSRKNTDVRILMPLYGFIDRSSLTLISDDFSVNFNNHTEKTGLYKSVLPGSTVPVYFLYSRKYFDREGIYGPTASSAYPDNGMRYSLLSQAALCLNEKIGWEPDIYHSHDWPTGLNPVFLRKKKDQNKKSSVFTIHNIGYQGLFSLRELPWTGLTEDEVSRFGFQENRMMNYLKAGVENCDCITTVSPTYAREIQTEQYGYGLDSVLKKRKDHLIGIVNGVDYNDWNPETDENIRPYNYSVSTIETKKQVKKMLQKEMNLKESSDIPVFSMVSRLVFQKGIPELCGPDSGILEDFCRNNRVQVIILGTGEKWCEDELHRLAETLPNLAVRITYNDYLSHLIEAGSDFFMMPSRYEPCGLNQLYSLKYGTIPVVRRTGGLADTVRQPDENNENGTGFLFDEISGSALLDSLNQACSFWYEKPDVISQMRQLAMNQDFSWGPSADKYLEVYKSSLES